MSKITSKFQVTIPKAVAQAYQLRPGAELVFEPAGDGIRIRLPQREKRRPGLGTVAWRLKLFDAILARQKEHNRHLLESGGQNQGKTDRDWTREGLYDRGLPR
ncbi:MAG: AbrB/MazE/SpoVT family DNA-binding domain-containing protein [Lentisphaeria bacterium]